MDQYSGFAAAGSGRNHDAVGLFVGDDLHLSRGERPEELLVFLGRQVALDLVDAFAAEVFCDETPVVHLEIVLHELQRRIVVLDPADVHRVVEDQKSPFELQCPDLREIEECLLDLAQLQVVPFKEHRPVVGLELIQ